MRRALGRDLRAVGHREQLLARARQPREPFADRARDRTANAAVDFIEDDRVGAALLGERDLEREDEAREFTAACDFRQRREGGAGVGRDKKFDAVDPFGSPALGGRRSTSVWKRAASSLSGASSPATAASSRIAALAR